MKHTSRHRMTGLSLIELMVALTISAVLIFGATQVYVDSRGAYNVNETIARLQENARYAMSVMEPDIRMSNYWGLIKGASLVTSQVAQTSAASAPAANAEANYCGNNFAIDLNTTLQGDNNGMIAGATGFLSTSRTASCNTAAGTGWLTTPMLSADTMTVRRASTIASVDGAGNPLGVNHVLQICSTRLSGNLISDGSACGTSPTNQLNNLIVNAYYIDANSAQVNGLPSLRRKALTTVGTVISFVDQEIMAGVEDMQVQFGIDTTGANGFPSRYVNPNEVPAGAAIVAVRLWLLIRSDTPESGFVDGRTYAYGDRLVANGSVANLHLTTSRGKAFQPTLDTGTSFTALKRYRRILVCRTFQVRNSLGT